MTRGSFLLITDDKMLLSIEFNGDMYPEGYGDEALWELRNNVKNEEDFRKFVEKFNEEHHNYEDIDEFVIELNRDFFIKDGTMNFNTFNYYETFFSDYLFIANVSNEDVEIVTRNDKPATIDLSYGALRLYFGKIDKYTFKYYERFTPKNENEA